MEEKNKSKVLIYIITILTILVIAMIAGGIYAYKSLAEKIDANSNAQNNNTENTQNENTIKNTNTESVNTENTIEDTPTYVDPDAKQITLNGKTHYVKVETKVKEKTETGSTVSFKLTVDGKQVNGIKDSYCTNDSLTMDMYEILKIKDSKINEEYILLKTYGYNQYVYIIDENENLIGEKITHFGGATFVINGVTMQLEINNNSIIDYKYIGGDNRKLGKYKYTIENREMVEMLVQTYNGDEYKGSGKIY